MSSRPSVSSEEGSGLHYILRELLLRLETAKDLIDVNCAAGEARQQLEELLKAVQEGVKSN